MVNESDIRGLASITIRDSVLGDLGVAAGATIPTGETFAHTFDFVASADQFDTLHTITATAWSTNGIVHRRTIDFCIRLRRPAIQLFLKSPSSITDVAGASLEIRIEPQAINGIGTSGVTRWEVEDELADFYLEGEGTSGLDRVYTYPTQMPPVAGSFSRQIVFTAWDAFGFSATRTTPYTLHSQAEGGPDPDGDGMHNEYEVANGLNPLFDDALRDPDRDGSTNLAESLFGTRARDASSRPNLMVDETSPGTVEIRWPSVPGHNYRLIQRLGLNRWVEIRSLTATENESATQIPASGGAVLVRVVASKP